MTKNNSWQTMRLGDFADINPPVTLERGKVYPFMDMANVVPLSRMIGLDEKKIFSGSGSRFKNGDTLFARITPCLENGKITQIKNIDGPGFGSTEFYVLRGRKNISDNDYIFYLTRTYKVRKLAEQSMIGASGRQRVERTAFENILVSVPKDINYQIKLAQILSSFDEKIENNNQIIQTLEEIAKAIFKEWFVSYHFPKHKNLLMTESELGRIPVGWHIAALSDLFQNVIERYTSDNKYDGMPYVPIDVISSKKLVLEKIAAPEEARSSLIRFKKGDVLFGAMRPYFHKVTISPFDGLTRTTCLVLRNKNFKYYTYAVLVLFNESTIAYATSHSQGSTIPYVKWNGSLADMPVILPTETIAEQLNEQILPILKQMENISIENQKLIISRDLLLPRLMSGEISL